MELTATIRASWKSVPVSICKASTHFNTSTTRRSICTHRISTIHQAITIIVNAISAIVLLGIPVSTNTPGTARESLAIRISTIHETVPVIVCPVGAVFGAGRAGGICRAVGVCAIDQSISVVVQSVRAVFRDAHTERAEGTVGIGAIDQSVSVVVETVAAVLYTGDAGRIQRAVRVCAVSKPIAVVVQPVVANLRRGSLEGIASLGNTAYTVLLNMCANTEPTRGGSKTFVDASVAVVVETVAGLGGGKSSLLARD